jgi:very-short-patch-repair endonuclease
VWEAVEERPWSDVLKEYERDPLTALLDSQDGVIARWQARRYLTEGAIRHRISSGRWQRVHRGILRVYGGPLQLTQRRWVAVLAASTANDAACLGGVSALQVLGLRNITTPRIHVLVAGERQINPSAGAIIHRARLIEEDRHPVARPPVTMPGRSVVDAAAWARSDDEARLVIVASFQQRLVSAAEIRQVLDRMPTTRRRQLVAATVDEASGGSHTLGELALTKICRDAGLPMPTRQVRIKDQRGRRRYLDAVFDNWHVAVEVDGAHHDEVPFRWDDMDRENDIVLAGYRILRFPSHVVREQPQVVAARLRKALEIAGWRPAI